MIWVKIPLREMQETKDRMMMMGNGEGGGVRGTGNMAGNE